MSKQQCYTYWLHVIHTGCIDGYILGMYDSSMQGYTYPVDKTSKNIFFLTQDS